MKCDVCHHENSHHDISTRTTSTLDERGKLIQGKRTCYVIKVCMVEKCSCASTHTREQVTLRPNKPRHLFDIV